ncbi:GAF and ANTAR domain-containing protein [Streptomyces sp. YC504]|uniref:GAF and ANTAR domain-containing protein n=1 Tax=Streptomyces mesophilus TaxID=1775132 RepID=A0A6G4XQX2_9ACTN|nr:GAF and ANTAR domain-containing protein [Streptomyces mesophilus]NGO79838.1 GAF and ANTAR domain-containing protein [Streptomyces mesophilus]
MPERIRAAADEAPEERLPQRMCAAMCEALPVDGATFSLLTHFPQRQLLCASDDVGIRLEELQFESGQGPCIMASATAHVVLWEDVREHRALWPLFGPLLREHLPQVGAVYAFPLLTGGQCVGAVDLFRYEPKPMDDFTVREALAGAAEIAKVLQVHAMNRLFTDDLPPWEPAEVIEAHWGTTHLATGVLAEQWGVGPEAALDRMRARAIAEGIPLPDLAAHVLAGGAVPDDVADAWPEQSPRRGDSP